MGLLDSAPKDLKELKTPKDVQEGSVNPFARFMGMQQPSTPRKKPLVTNFKVDPDLADNKRAENTIGAFVLGMNIQGDPEEVKKILHAYTKKRYAAIEELIDKCAKEGYIGTISTKDKNLLYKLLNIGSLGSFFEHCMYIRLPWNLIDSIFRTWTEIHDRALIKATGSYMDVQYPWDKESLLSKQLKTMDEVFLTMGLKEF